MISGRDIVVIGGDFARHPSSAEHLLRRFAQKNRIIWIETIGLRRPTLSLFDAKRAVGKLARLGQAKVRSVRPDLPELLSVVTPTMWPFHDVGWIRRRNEASLIDTARQEIERRGFKDFVLFATVPLAAGLGVRLGAKAVVYYCMDDWSRWPGLLKDAIPVWEKRLIDEAALVVATSDELVRSKSTAGKPARLLPHGVDVEHFSRAAKARGAIRHLTYFGLLDARTDLDALARVARERPHATLDLIGPVQIDVAALKALPNVRFHGPVPYAHLPDALRPADALLLPYRIDALAKSINPLKIREALATGKPVVAMALPELGKIPGLIRTETAEAFVDACLALVDGRLLPPAEDLSDWLAASSWESRAEELSGWIDAALRP